MALAIPGKSALQQRGIPDCIFGYLIIARNTRNGGAGNGERQQRFPIGDRHDHRESQGTRDDEC